MKVKKSDNNISCTRCSIWYFVDRVYYNYAESQEISQGETQSHLLRLGSFDCDWSVKPVCVHWDFSSK